MIRSQSVQAILGVLYLAPTILRPRPRPSRTRPEQQIPPHPHSRLERSAPLTRRGLQMRMYVRLVLSDSNLTSCPRAAAATAIASYTSSEDLLPVPSSVSPSAPVPTPSTAPGNASRRLACTLSCTLPPPLPPLRVDRVCAATSDTGLLDVW